jgi:hypothetical protein
VSGGGQPGGYDDYTQFLADGLLHNSSPVVCLVTDASTASAVALALHAKSPDWAELPKAEGRLLRFETDTAAELSDQQASALCAELAATEHWLYIEDVDVLLDSRGGRHLLTALLAGVANGDLAAVIASAQPDSLNRLRSDALRLMGFALIVEGPGPSGAFELSRSISVVREAQDRDDTGWTIAVRFDLTSPITPYADYDAGAAIAGAVELVDTAHVIEPPDGPPLGAMIGLRADAFTVTQEDAAYATATMAAQRLVGRLLKSGESVKATRAIYYA